jgi:chorismate mutase
MTSTRGAAHLAALRKRVERTDDAILALLVERAALARRIGAAKEASGRPVLDPAREARVVRRAAARARELGLPPEPVRALFWDIIAMCRAEQLRPEPPGRPRTSRRRRAS